MTKSKFSAFSAFSPYYFHVFSTFSPHFFNSAFSPHLLCGDPQKIAEKMRNSAKDAEIWGTGPAQLNSFMDHCAGVSDLCPVVVFISKHLPNWFINGSPCWRQWPVPSCRVYFQTPPQLINLWVTMLDSVTCAQLSCSFPDTCLTNSFTGHISDLWMN